MILDTVYAQEDTKAIGTVQLESNQPRVLEVSWDAWNAPTETPVDYQVNWARADQNYPTETSYTITGLEHVRYQVRVRARYNGSFGPWIEVELGGPYGST